MQTVEGTITVVQEGRFRLDTDDGRSLLCILSRRAAQEADDLESLMARGARVRVRCVPAAQRLALLARDVRAARAQGAVAWR